MSFEPNSWVWKPSDSKYLEPVVIQTAKQINGTVKFAVRQSGYCLSKSGKWEYEPMPSSRDEEFLESCRFDSWQDAADAIVKHCKPKGRFER